jgi:GTP-binding protein Era
LQIDNAALIFTALQRNSNMTENNNTHKAGFVNIVGKPNVGKSTLMNALLGHRLCIATSKAQTTRHRILGILNGDNFQIVYSDTPGILEPKYELHQRMMAFVLQSLEDADLLLYVIEIGEKADEKVLKLLKKCDAPLMVVINKIDKSQQEEVKNQMNYWQNILPESTVIPISALEKFNLDTLFEKVITQLPVCPPYFPKEEDNISDKTDRFFAAEIIREQIFLNYKQEIPYSCEVVITDFKEKEDIFFIRAEIFVERTTQRQILIGKNGEAIKKVGIGARAGLEQFFQKKVFLETYIRVEENWRNQPQKLRKFGYDLE